MRGSSEEMPSTRRGHHLNIVRSINNKYGRSSTMVSAFVKAVLLLCFLRSIARVTGQISCIPDYFRYIQDESSEEISGRIEIQRAPKGIALQISAVLSIAAALPTKYVGRIELAQSKEQSVKAVQQGRPLKYNIRFPLRQPIPTLTGLWFNNRLTCTGPRATGQVVTSIVLNHTLYPPGVIPLSIEESNVIPNAPEVDTVSVRPVPPSQPPSSRPPSSRPSPPWFVSPSTQPVSTFPATSSIRPVTSTTEIAVVRPKPGGGKDQNGCGRSNLANRINLLIAGGVETSPGQWPWLVAIFIAKFNFEFQCAGSLVSNTHVITAAHCFHASNTTLPSGVFLVSIGRYRLRDWREKGSVNIEVAEYRLHPDYRMNSEQGSAGSADSDVAVIILRESVEYTMSIRPICLWAAPTDLESVVGKVGFVVGWGRDELGNDYVQEPRQIKAPIVSQAVCLWSNSDFVLFTSNRTFCAGTRNGSGPCNGDSGSGFVMYDSITDRYYLRGIVSRSLLDRSTRSCDLTQYVVYVDVAKYLDWIRDQIST